MKAKDRQRIRLLCRMRAAVAGLALAAVAAGGLAVPVAAQSFEHGLTADYGDAAPAIVEALRSTDTGSKDIQSFYAARGWAPLWIHDGAIGSEGDALLRLIVSADLDGLDPGDYRPRALASALDRASDGSPKALARAEMLLSRSLVALARDMRRPRDVGMLYADAELTPREADPREILERAAAAPSLQAYLDGLGWMNLVYAGLRRAGATWLEAHEWEGDAADQRRLIRLNLDRARALPADPGRRFILVDAAAARLWMYADGRVQGTMRVVVGKPSEPTPMMAALVRYASVNPYWNIPPDLVPTRVAQGVLASGPTYLKTKNFEILSDWSDQARPLDPSEVDWQAVASGHAELRVRQRPGPNNPMGRIKFMFPNSLGVYLHDTPEKALLREGERLFSAGCVRVEDAPRLARWLFGKPVPIGTGTQERRLDLPEAVPVYLTYLTAAADGADLVFRDDVYGRDPVGVASLGGSGRGR